MNVCIIVLNHRHSKKLSEIAEALASGIRVNGHRVDVIDGITDTGKKISFYDHICVGTDAPGILGGKVHKSVGAFLGQCGTIGGKKSFAFMHKGGLRRMKSMRMLMDRMEHEGMFIKLSEFISSTQEAEVIGKRLNIN
jgi:menaquinone-dependent protoporphyrinogen IX oxidase